MPGISRRPATAGTGRRVRPGSPRTGPCEPIRDRRRRGRCRCGEAQPEEDARTRHRGRGSGAGRRADDDHPDRSAARLAGGPAPSAADRGAHPGTDRPRTAQRKPRSEAAIAQDLADCGRPRRRHHCVGIHIQDEPVLAAERGHRPERDYGGLPEPERGLRTWTGQFRLRADDASDPVGVRLDDERRQPSVHRRQDRQAGTGTHHADPGRRGGLVAEPASSVQPV